jgi:drug/metabolite transporter (DMT)-like permease
LGLERLTYLTQTEISSNLNMGDHKSKRPRLYDLPYLLLILAVFFWAGNFIIGRAVRANIPPVALAFWRWAGASMLLAGIALPYVKRDWRTVKGNLPVLTLLSAFGVASFNTLLYTGLQWTTAINAFLMQSLMPVLIVAISLLFFHERITPRQAGGIVISLLGAVTIIARGDAALLGALAINRGDIFVFLAVISYAGYSAALRLRPPIHPLSLLLTTFVIGTSMLLPVYLWEVCTTPPMNVSVQSALAIIYVAVFPSIASYFCYNRGVEMVGANRAGLFIHLMPVFGSIMAIIFLDERLRWFHLLGIALIASGIALTTREQPRQPGLASDLERS